MQQQMSKQQSTERDGPVNDSLNFTVDSIDMIGDISGRSPIPTKRQFKSIDEEFEKGE